MTSKQVEWVYKYAERARESIESKEMRVEVGDPRSLFPMRIEVFGEFRSLVLRPGGWIVEISSERVVGKLEGSELVIYPNPLVPGPLVRGHVRSRLRHAELVRQKGEVEGQGHTV